MARHFLIWLDLSGIDLRTVDGPVLDRFLRHDCRCASRVPIRLRHWRKRRLCPELTVFVRFPETTGRVETPGDLEGNMRLVEAYLIKSARLGGYLPRAKDPPPGNIVMRRGLGRLSDIALGETLQFNDVGNCKVKSTVTVSTLCGTLLTRFSPISQTFVLVVV